MPKFSFCEPATAGPGRKWCIRELTDAGPKYGGGIDTGPLCRAWDHSYERGFNGRDVDVEITDFYLTWSTCLRCAKLYQQYKERER